MNYCATDDFDRFSFSMTIVDVIWLVRKHVTDFNAIKGTTNSTEGWRKGSKVVYSDYNKGIRKEAVSDKLSLYSSRRAHNTTAYAVSIIK